MGEALPARQFWQLSVVSYRDYRVTRLRGGAFNFAHTPEIESGIDRSIVRSDMKFVALRCAGIRLIPRLGLRQSPRIDDDEDSEKLRR